MLFLLVRLGGDDYAIEAKRVRRVVPFARLSPLRSGARHLAGGLNYHGTPVPVLDLTLLITGAPSPCRFGTRIILAEVQIPGGESRLLGLLAAEVATVAHFQREDFQSAGAPRKDAPWLGPIAESEQRFVQRLGIDRLLSAETLAALVAQGETVLAA